MVADDRRVSPHRDRRRRLGDLVEAWFRDTFHNLPISTELYNRFFAAKEDLKARLRAKEQ